MQTRDPALPGAAAAIERHRSIHDLIDRLGYGRAAQQMSEEFHSMLLELQQQWKDMASNAGTGPKGIKGQFTVKIRASINPNDGSLELGWDCDRKVSKRPRPGAIMYLAKDGNFADDDPRQPRLPNVDLHSAPPPLLRSAPPPTRDASVPPAQPSAPAQPPAQDHDPETGEVRP